MLLPSSFKTRKRLDIFLITSYGANETFYALSNLMERLNSIWFLATSNYLFGITPNIILPCWICLSENYDARNRF